MQGVGVPGVGATERILGWEGRIQGVGGTDTEQKGGSWGVGVRRILGWDRPGTDGSWGGTDPGSRGRTRGRGTPAGERHPQPSPRGPARAGAQGSWRLRRRGRRAWSPGTPLRGSSGSGRGLLTISSGDDVARGKGVRPCLFSLDAGPSWMCLRCVDVALRWSPSAPVCVADRRRHRLCGNARLPH